MNVVSSAEKTAPVAARRGRRFGSPPPIPERPRFLRELAVVQLADKILIDGADRLHAFEGRAARGALAALLPLMDGTRTMREIEDALPGVSPAEIAEAVFSLSEWQLLEAAQVAQEPDLAANPETLAFFRRYAGATGANRSGPEAWRKLQDSEVLILDSGAAFEPADALKTVLRAAGVGQVSMSKPAPGDLGRSSAQTRSLVVSMTVGAEDSRWHEELDDCCAGRRMSWLRAVLDGASGIAQLGPFFNSREDTCFRCFSRLHLQPLPGERASGHSVPSSELRFFAGLVAVEVIYLLTQIGPPLKGRSFRQYALPEWQSQDHCWPRVPGCSRCLRVADSAGGWPVDAGGRTFIDSAYVFESCVGHESRPAFQVRTRRGSMGASLQAKQQHPRFPNCAEHKLPGSLPQLGSAVLDLLQQQRVHTGRPVVRDDLAVMLLTAAGIRSGQTVDKAVRRWGATGGNLGSVQLFAAVHCVAGIDPGLYLYQPGEHSLARFERHSGALAVRDFMSRLVSNKAGDQPDAMILLTGLFGRISLKYDAFGYRLVNLDGGVALGQLHLVAGSLGLCSHTEVRWADDLITNQLNLDPSLEQATAVLSLSRRGGLPDSSRRPASPGTPASSKPLEDFRGISLPAALEMAVRDSRVEERDVDRGPFAVPFELLKPPSYQGASVPLPAPARGGRTAGEVLTERISIRRYTHDLVRVDDLSTMLFCAIHGDKADWPQEHEAGCSIRLLALAWRVEGLAPGVYEYSADDHALKPLPVPADARSASELFVQSDFAAAPLIVWISGNLAAACAAQGAFGHRQLLLRAGAAAHRLWMAAIARGLGGCIVAGVVPGAARRLLDLDGYRRASLAAFAAGHPFRPFGLHASQEPASADVLASL